jgi:hypothetical protein
MPKWLEWFIRGIVEAIVAEQGVGRFVPEERVTGVYLFQWVSGAAAVVVDGEELPLRNDLADHSPTGFGWGYGGSGPAQLSLALLAHLLEDDALAVVWYQRFKDHFVANLIQTAEYEFTARDLAVEFLICYLIEVVWGMCHGRLAL